MAATAPVLKYHVWKRSDDAVTYLCGVGDATNALSADWARTLPGLVCADCLQHLSENESGDSEAYLSSVVEAR